MLHLPFTLAMRLKVENSLWCKSGFNPYTVSVARQLDVGEWLALYTVSVVRPTYLTGGRLSKGLLTLSLSTSGCRGVTESLHCQRYWVDYSVEYGAFKIYTCNVTSLDLTTLCSAVCLSLQCQRGYRSTTECIV